MSKPEHVLIIENVPTDAELNEHEIRKVLPDSEFLRVETQDNFLAALKSFRPDLIISDYKLPQFDGLRALKLALEQAPDTPFIIVTGSMNEDTAVECMKTGAWDYIIKEHRKRLGPAIVSVMEQKQVRRERSLAEQEQRESKALLEAVVDNLPVMLFLKEAKNLRFVMFNRAGEELLGHDRKSLIGKSDLDFFPPEQATFFIAKDREVLDGETGFLDIAEESILTAGHGTRLLHTRKVSIRGGDGATKYLLGISEDITARKKAETERERLMTAIEQAGEAVTITDPEGIIQYVNPAFEKITGYSRDEVVGKNPRILKSGKQDGTFYRELWKNISTGKAWRNRIINRRKDGALYTEEATITPVHNAAGVIVNYVAVKKDITDQLRLENQMLQSQKMEAVGLLAGGVAHDFNNILTAIISYAELIRKGLPPGAPMRDDAQEILTASDRAVSLTRQLLAFSRRQILEPRMADINKIVNDMTNMLRRLLGEDIVLSINQWPAPCLAKVDPGQIEQVIMNLVVNARDAMPKGGRITLETDIVTAAEELFAAHPNLPRGPLVRLITSDTGTGMDGEVKKHIFEPFFTTKEKGKGTGLGLPTVFGIVKQSGGEIEVNSEPGKGTTFAIYLPLAVNTAQPSEKDKDKARSTTVRGNETVMLVEDDETLRRLGARILKENGYTVLASAGGAEALAELERRGKPVDLLVTDMVLPGMNGLELAREAARRKLTGRTLYMSGYTADTIVKHGVLEPGLAFIYKPFTVEAFSAKLRDVLDGPADQAKA